jgi:hexokinase
MAHIRTIIRLVTHRATALLATAIHALWCLRASAEGLKPADMGRVAVGCNGSVIERYPGFRQRSQEYLGKLVEGEGAGRDSVELEVAWESAIYGAAVSVGCLEGL